MGNKVETQLARVANRPGVIPTSQVIVLKEQELDCDLATAIRRIRTCGQTSHSRILVIAPDDEKVEPSPSEASVVLASAPTTLGQVARRGAQAALSKLGAELQPIETSLRRYLGEMGDALAQLQRHLPAGSVDDECAAGLRTLEHAISWAGALAGDLTERVGDAAEGFQSVDTHELLVDMATQVEATLPDVRVTVGPSTGAQCRAKPAALAEAFFLGLALVAHRVGGRGSVTVELEATPDSLIHRFLGNGEPKPVNAPDSVARFREVVVGMHRGRVYQDDLGSGGTGLAIHLPR